MLFVRLHVLPLYTFKRKIRIYPAISVVWTVVSQVFMDAGLGLLKWRPLLAGECCLGVWFLVYAGKLFEFESECGLCVLG